MDKDHALPPLSPIQSLAGTPCKSLALSPSLPHSSATVPSSPPLSPSSTPLSLPYTHSSPSCPTPPQPFLAHTSTHCLGSPVSSSDQDDLTCLSWLHQRRNLLPMQPLLKTTNSSFCGGDPHSNLVLAPQGAPSSSSSSSPGKPPYSFSSLIFMAIEESSEKQLPVKGIYEWIVNTFPYYRAAPGGWRNSVRHNLSLSKSFRRISREKNKSGGKGSLWCVCPEYRPALLEVLKKTHGCHSSHIHHLLNNSTLPESSDYGSSVICETVEMSDALSSHEHCSLTPDHEELVAIESVTLHHQEEVEEEEVHDEEELKVLKHQQEEMMEMGEEDASEEKDPLADSGYIELHYYQYNQFQYLVLPGDTELDLETVEILQLDAEAQEAAGSLLDLAGGGHSG
ncbi:forkhead box protein N2 [Engraulis encrasicolus]|uniref:forkhead box protein N2 n=1 Tax=Engraulis encrasicolus TaxID=184585 RepID=UPI002FD4A9E1